MENAEMKLEAMTLKPDPDYLAPDGSKIRLLPTMKGGGLAHCTLAPGKISTAVKHKTVEEIWYFMEGQGEVCREREQREGEVVKVSPCVSVTIPVGTHFQFRNTGTESLLTGERPRLSCNGFWKGNSNGKL